MATIFGATAIDLLPGVLRSCFAQRPTSVERGSDRFLGLVDDRRSIRESEKVHDSGPPTRKDVTCVRSGNVAGRFS